MRLARLIRDGGATWPCAATEPKTGQRDRSLVFGIGYLNKKGNVPMGKPKVDLNLPS